MIPNFMPSFELQIREWAGTSLPDGPWEMTQGHRQPQDFWL